MRAEHVQLDQTFEALAEGFRADPRSAGLIEWKRFEAALLAHLNVVERGCWDYFEDHERAEKDFKMWLGGMTTEEGARQQPSGRPDPYRGEPRYLTFTMTFLLVRPSPSDTAMASLASSKVLAANRSRPAASPFTPRAREPSTRRSSGEWTRTSGQQSPTIHFRS